MSECAPVCAFYLCMALDSLISTKLYSYIIYPASPHNGHSSPLLENWLWRHYLNHPGKLQSRKCYTLALKNITLKMLNNWVSLIFKITFHSSVHLCQSLTLRNMELTNHLSTTSEHGKPLGSSALNIWSPYEFYNGLITFFKVCLFILSMDALFGIATFLAQWEQKGYAKQQTV